jgi:hypothetical protein
MWHALGQAGPHQFITCFRHSDTDGLPVTDWETKKAHWRRQFLQFVDRTRLEQHAGSIDLVEGASECTDDARATGYKPDERRRALNNARGAAAGWNGGFRGQRVGNADGDEGVIPASSRLVLGPGAWFTIGSGAATSWERPS